jgi:hypothetical protein
VAGALVVWATVQFPLLGALKFNVCVCARIHECACMCVCVFVYARVRVLLMCAEHVGRERRKVVGGLVGDGENKIGRGRGPRGYGRGSGRE